MKRKFIFLLVILGISGLGFFAYKVFADRSPKTGVLKVNSTPTVAVFLDNNHLGRSPYEDKVTEGEYTVKLTPESTVDQTPSWQGKVKIFPGMLTYINAQFGDSEFNTAIDVLWLEKITSKESELSVITNPDGASLSLDGETKGNTPLSLSNVSVGDHTIVLTSPGFMARTLKVKTTAGYKLIASVKMALSGENTGGENPLASASAELTPSVEPETGTTPTPSAKVTPKTSTTPESSTTNPDKPYIIIKETPTGFLRVRMEPSISATQAAEVSPGDKFSILDDQNGWYEINYNGKDTGWVSGQYAEKIE